jgi:hypothetical protein
VIHVLLFLTAGLFCSHADRSIKIRLLIELACAPNKCLTLAEMQAMCGVEALMQDRLEIMVRNGFLGVRGDRLVLTPKAGLAAPSACRSADPPHQSDLMFGAGLGNL